MKNIFLLLFLVVLSGCATQNSISGKQLAFNPSVAPTAGMAEIIVFRSQPLTPKHPPSYLYVPTLLINGKQLGKLSQGKYVVISIPKGIHRISTDTDISNQLPAGLGFDEVNRSAESINVLPGWRYYYDLSTEGVPGINSAMNIVHVLTRSNEQFALNFIKVHNGISVAISHP